LLHQWLIENIENIVIIANIALVGVLLWQVSLIKKQLIHSEKTSKIAYEPFLAPRFVEQKNSNNSYTYLENIGNGSARDIHLKIIDEKTGNEIASVNRYAFRVKESTIPLFISNDYPLFRIKGYYRNVIRDKIFENQVYKFPPEEVDNI